MSKPGSTVSIVAAGNRPVVIDSGRHLAPGECADIELGPLAEQHLASGALRRTEREAPPQRQPIAPQRSEEDS